MKFYARVLSSSALLALAACGAEPDAGGDNSSAASMEMPADDSAEAPPKSAADPMIVPPDLEEEPVSPAGPGEPESSRPTTGKSNPGF